MSPADVKNCKEEGTRRRDCLVHFDEPLAALDYAADDCGVGVSFAQGFEELVGDVADEHARRRSGTHAGPRGTWVVPGVLRPDEGVECVINAGPRTTAQRR